MEIKIKWEVLRAVSPTTRWPRIILRSSSQSHKDFLSRRHQKLKVKKPHTSNNRPSLLFFLIFFSNQAVTCSQRQLHTATCSHQSLVLPRHAWSFSQSLVSPCRWGGMFQTWFGFIWLCFAPRRHLKCRLNAKQVLVFFNEMFSLFVISKQGPSWSMNSSAGCCSCLIWPHWLHISIYSPGHALMWHYDSWDKLACQSLTIDLNTGLQEVLVSVFSLVFFVVFGVVVAADIPPWVE